MRSTPFPIPFALAVLALCAWATTSRAVGVCSCPVNMCGGQVTAKGITFSLGSGYVISVAGSGLHVLGSPSGLAENGGQGLPALLMRPGNSPLPAGTEVWIQVPEESEAIHLFDNPLTRLKCSNDNSAVTFYLEEFASGTTDPTIFYPSFGGHGDVSLAIEMVGCAPDYAPVLTGIEARSTDTDNDGDTDEADENALRAATGVGPAYYDLDWANGVDAADLAILLTEARRRVIADPLCNPPGVPPVYTMIPPHQVTNLTVTRQDATTLRLRWTAVGDDGWDRSASSYSVRRSTSPITPQNFAAATVVGSPTPLTGGLLMTLDVPYTPGQTVYFALTATDDVDNVSAMSNVAQYVDVAPAASTMTAVAGRSMALVNWTATGEDGTLGTAAQFDLRWSNGPITAANFSMATQVATPTPGPAGTVYCVEISPLVSCTNHYFAVRTRDAAGNWSALSNVPLAKTKCTGNLMYFCSGGAARPADDPEGIADEFSLHVPSSARLATPVQIAWSTTPEQEGLPLELALFDVSGRRARVFERGLASAGAFQSSWDMTDAGGARVRPGFYVLRLRVGERTQTRPIVVTN